MADLRKAPLAIEAVRRIDAIFAIEREINGLAAEQRLAVRQKRITPLIDELKAWMLTERARLSRHADIEGDRRHAHALAGFHPLSRRWSHLSQ